MKLIAKIVAALILVVLMLFAFTYGHYIAMLLFLFAATGLIDNEGASPKIRAGFMIVLISIGVYIISRPMSHEDKVAHQFNSSGENMYVSSYLKKHLHDPESYEHVKTTYKDNGTYLTVLVQYRANNALGAKVLSSETMDVDINGTVLKVY